MAIRESSSLTSLLLTSPVCKRTPRLKFTVYRGQAFSTDCVCCPACLVCVPCTSPFTRLPVTCPKAAIFLTTCSIVVVYPTLHAFLLQIIARQIPTRLTLNAVDSDFHQTGLCLEPQLVGLETVAEPQFGYICTIWKKQKHKKPLNNYWSFYSAEIRSDWETFHVCSLVRLNIKMWKNQWQAWWRGERALVITKGV